MSKLKIENVKIREIVENFRNGTWAVPEFQRGYEWGKQKSKAARLIDSLFRGFPVSALLLWETDNNYRSRDDAKMRSATWIVDGQQRITTLDKVLDGENEIRVVFNPREKDNKTGFEGAFQIESAVTKKSNDWIPVSRILDDKDFHTIRGYESTEKYQDMLQRLHDIMNYEIPVITMVGYSLAEASDAFKRINMQGTKLKAADIYASEIAGRHDNVIASKFMPFIKQLHDEKGFNGINQMHFFKICEHNAKCKKQSLYSLEKSILTAAWEKTAKATDKVIAFLDRQFGVKKMDILRSGALLVVPIVLFSTLPTDELDQDKLAGWLALASLHHHYTGSTETALDKDLAACGHQNPISSLLGNIKESRRLSKLLATPESFSGQLNDKGALFAAYVACRHKGCIGLFSGKSLTTYENANQHHLFPRSRFAVASGRNGLSRRDSDSIANIAFIKADANRKLGDEPPAVYLEGMDESRLESQCIPLDKKLWVMDEAEAFWKARRKLLADAFNAFVQQKLPKSRLK